MVGYGAALDNRPFSLHLFEETDKVKPLEDEHASSYGVIVRKLSN